MHKSWFENDLCVIRNITSMYRWDSVVVHYIISIYTTDMLLCCCCVSNLTCIFLLFIFLTRLTMRKRLFSIYSYRVFSFVFFLFEYPTIHTLSHRSYIKEKCHTINCRYGDIYVPSISSWSDANWEARCKREQGCYFFCSFLRKNTRFDDDGDSYQRLNEKKKEISTTKMETFCET